MHCALLRESSEAGKTFPIIVGWNRPGVGRVVLKAGYRLRCGQLEHKPQATCIQESYSRECFLFSQSCINFLFFFFNHGHCQGWRKVKVSVCWSARGRGRVWKYERSKEAFTVWAQSVCTLWVASHQPTAPVVTLKERSGGDAGGNGACEGLLLYIFTLRFLGRPAKTSSWLERRTERKGERDGSTVWKYALKTSRKGVFSAEVVKMWLELSCWSVDIL